jgi:hypothetical protein
VVTRPTVAPQVLGSTPSGSKFLRICDILAQIGLIEYSYQQVATSFPEVHLERTPKLSILTRSEVRRKNMCEAHLERTPKLSVLGSECSALKRHVLICKDILELLESC